ncbi:MAG: D-aminoacylase, partial [Candidatus Sumerlaeota bacterium]|nr:D-aminoacylase [Candidatus Sumerlaeota bacterium]
MISPRYDTIIRNGMIHDGGGGKPCAGDVAIAGDRIAAVGALAGAGAKEEIDASGLAVAPGFINMLSWATVSLINDGRSMSDIRQGVTTEVVGEGSSMGPLNPAMKRYMAEHQGYIKYHVSWTTLNEYLEYLTRRGISCNIASFVGATTLRIHEVGYENRPPSAAELERMKALLRQAMREGAVGVSTALIYAPACFARTDEIIELCKTAAEFDGLHISHMRNEGSRLLEAFDELLAVGRESGIRSEIYHLKAAGQANWPRMDALIARVEKERAAGRPISADMYTYAASATGFDASMPPWVQEGGFEA